VRCERGAPATLVLEWSSVKPDDRTSPVSMELYLDRDRRCVIEIGELPRSCDFSEDQRSVTCANRDGSRPHRVQLRQDGSRVQVFVTTPERTFLLAELQLP
jgi:hypothetical protein